MANIYVQTSDSSKVIKIPSNIENTSVVKNDFLVTDFGLTNTLTNVAWRKVREVANQNGLKVNRKESVCWRLVR